tara:strand:+ start:61 stop:234 length:174 start_codon:yes stop_codon:yes gene_type:complete
MKFNNAFKDLHLASEKFKASIKAQFKVELALLKAELAILKVKLKQYEKKLKKIIDLD